MCRLTLMIDFVEKKMAANMAALMSWKKIVQASASIFTDFLISTGNH